jgi:hypothetical protein
MDELEPVNITELHTSIKNTIRGFFAPSAVPSVDYYSRVERKIIAPAIFFQLNSINGNPDSASGQFDGTFNFSAFCIVPYNAPNAILSARVLGSSLISKLNGQRFGQTLGRATVTLMEGDSFDQENVEYETVRVDWSHEGMLGESPFNDDGSITPTELWVGFYPDTGVENIDKYIKIAPTE